MTAHKADAGGVPEVPPRAEPEVAAVASSEGPDAAGVLRDGGRPDGAGMAAGAGPDAAAGAQPGGRLIVCAPLWPEARAVRRGIGGGGEVRVSGYGPGRARKQAGRLRQDTFGALAVAGTGG